MKTTPEQFAEFKQYHAEYLTRYGLRQWGIDYHHGPLAHSYAETEMQFKTKVAHVTLGVNWGNDAPLDSAQLRKTAKHEVNHLLLHALYWHAINRFISEDTLDEAEEAVVRTLDQLIPD